MSPGQARQGQVFKRCTRCNTRVPERRCPKCGARDSFTWAYVVDVTPKDTQGRLIGKRHQRKAQGFATRAAAQDALMSEINRLTEERTRLQSSLARHPWSNREAAQRVRDITAQLDTLWSQLRQARAARRVRMEEALGVHPVDETEKRRNNSDEEAA